MTPDVFIPESTLPDDISDLKFWLQHERSALFQKTPPARQGLFLSRQFTRLVDLTLIRLLSSTPLPPSLAVVGTGSYGRTEISPYSDIDVVFLVPRHLSTAEQKTVEHLVRHCWDFGMHVGHAVRSPDEYLRLLQSDVEVFTTIFDLRFLYGHLEIFSEFTAELQKQLTDAASYARLLENVWTERRQKFGMAYRLLEPNVKESGGGLRDVHNACWMFRLIENAMTSDRSSSNALDDAVSRGFLLPVQRTDLHDAFNFMQKVRNALHQIANRKQDVLSYDMQQRLSAFFNYGNDPTNAVERFMQDFFSHSRVIHALATSLKDKSAHHLIPVRPASSATIPVEPPFQVRRVSDRAILEFDGTFDRSVAEHPGLMMRAFLLLTKFHAVPSESIQLAIRDHLHRIDEAFLNSREVARDFCAIWKYEGQVAHGLRWMHELGFLERYLPEFSYVVAHYKYNVYHAYTTDEHLLVTVEKLEALLTADSERTSVVKLREIYDDLTLFEKNQLTWACFLHDIGKARDRDHCDVGVELASAMLSRLEYSGATDVILRLIRHHLRMEQTAFRRDLSDPSVITGFAAIVEDRRFLRMLYLLTFADMSASNASVWTEWKATLLHELFEKTDRWLRQQRIDREDPDLPDYTSYPMTDGVTVQFTDSSHYTCVTVTTPDQPFCLANICGALAASDINIFDATVHTRADGLVIDRFRVVHYLTGHLLTPDQQSRCKKLLHDTLMDQTPIEPRIQKAREKWKRRKRPSSVTPEVYFENTARHTIVDIFAPDRIGLLYEITRELAALDLNIHTAKIGTRLDGVADCFYVTDIHGHKIESLEDQQRIRRRLLQVIG
jgi:[protein-PII] uridylyltransferase